METKKIYLAGPMTGLPRFNYDAFHHAAKALRSVGHCVCSPAEMESDTYKATPPEDGTHESATSYGFNYREMLKLDLIWIAENATCIALLPGWEGSKGARAEASLAAALGLEFIFLTEEQYGPAVSTAVQEAGLDHFAALEQLTGIAKRDIKIAMMATLGLNTERA